uniref:Phosphatidylinositol/phosphatidylcholine transfer protein SFH8 isoform X1 n=1 Tax=Rhizophora mucronata TaxID=61149 RepID=A0A2P2MCW7_RHIMU
MWAPAILWFSSARVRRGQRWSV